MSLFVQDVAVSLVALAALLVLIGRVRRAFHPSRQTAACDSCPRCEEHANGPVTPRAQT